ncbi:malonate decarboxylase holo-ACP synthase [Mycolicibacterium sp. Dal123E01]|uniref:malonate decarboxylase holo-ACP synthase n=1 Tax=Mycolicibacterium sp. Dal123E01 TaxID=3457578 RepID=UPI00403ECDEC
MADRAMRPHDLVRLPDSTTLPDDAPAWAVQAIRDVPWVVIRRGLSPQRMIAVGVRGSTRSERYGTHLCLDDAREVVTPEALAHMSELREMPALATLRAIRPLMGRAGLAWGPTGSVGFELASGRGTVTPESDLDLIVRTDSVVAVLDALTALHRGFGSLATRVDCQIETSCGAVALAELVGRQPDVMLRTAEGPRLVARTAMP